MRHLTPGPSGLDSHDTICVGRTLDDLEEIQVVDAYSLVCRRIGHGLAGRADFETLGTKIIGVSMDSLESHRNFAKAHNLTFPLLADEKGAIAALYGVDTSRGFPSRTTFVIGLDGKIVRTFSPVKVAGHAAEQSWRTPSVRHPAPESAVE